MKIDDYKVMISKIETEAGTEFFAEYREFDFCCGGGETVEEAVNEARQNLEIYIDELHEMGKAIPEPIQELTYSGRVTLRLSKSMHKKAAECANREGISLNSFFVEAVSEKVGLCSMSPVLNKLEGTISKFADTVYTTMPILNTAIYLTQINSQSINGSGYRTTPQVIKLKGEIS